MSRDLNIPEKRAVEHIESVINHHIYIANRDSRMIERKTCSCSKEIQRIIQQEVEQNARAKCRKFVFIQLSGATGNRPQQIQLA